mmetsp:Transcript_5244/g.11688  ORF Transcript_5244/g.11688 Transcript_5244/m.11688 type:complete len:185 (+) Transcript_5244:96-650(+)|eukprot:CAMPEP_0116851004 /NCGR_PEP_ID=MMETSP0418-20121206/16472_1 /TAXON_ID=1158023 /ORGANISM="Astrosyne radiata, Strain 13vi08-1A" /LENGTH=184 /DNA_ID=CAMNT_0004482959 /DNA_START=96 /DNA_END=650 /DNA_ORIENTATION=+
MSPFADASDLTIDAEWDNMCDVMQEEELPSSSKEEVCTVLKEWTSDEESVDVDIMEVDEQIGSNFLCDDLFGPTCPSPVSPQEELVSITVDAKEDKFLTPPLTPEYPSSCSLSLSDVRETEQYREAFKKLVESMRRSQETRVSLTMKSPKAGDTYERRKSVSAVLNSIEQSRKNLQCCFGPIAE